MPDERDIVSLWIAFRKGDREAYVFLVNRFYTTLFDYGNKLCRDTSMVEDCIQDLFLEIWQRREYLSDTDHVKFYLLKALRRRIQSEQKDQQRWKRDAFEENSTVEFFGEFSVETRIIQQESSDYQLKKLRKVLGKLTKREREVIYLKFYQEMDYEQIATLLSINYQSVRNLVYTAIRELKKAWPRE